MKLVLKFLAFSFVFALFSCLQKKENDHDFDLEMVINREISGEAFYLQEAINMKLLVLKDVDTSAFILNEITTNYLVKVEQTINDLLKNVKNFNALELSNSKTINTYFFEADNYSNSADTFVSATENYKKEALNFFTNNQFLSAKVIRFTETSSVLNKGGQSIPKLNYLYKDASLNSVLTHLEHLKLNILLIEDAYLYECLNRINN